MLDIVALQDVKEEVHVETIDQFGTPSGIVFTNYPEPMQPKQHTRMVRRFDGQVKYFGRKTLVRILSAEEFAEKVAVLS